MKKLLLNAILTSILILTLGCGETLSNQTIVATVGTQILTLETLNAAYGEENWNQKTLDEQREIINQWVELNILYENAINLFKNDLAINFTSENAKKKIYANALVSHEIENIEFTRDELFSFYRLREAEYTEQVREFRVQRIFFNTEHEMREIKAMLDARQINFTPAAQRYSREPIGRNGGYMANMVTKAGPDSLLWKEIDNLNQWYEVTMPYEEGWIIARWYEYRLSTATRSFNDVREEIENYLKESRRSNIFESVLEKSRETSNVSIFF